MCKLTRENGVWWIGSGENRRRDDVVDAPEEEEEEGNLADFDWEAVVDEATDEGESRSGEKFYDAEDKDQGSPEVNEEIPATITREAVMLKFQAEFERTRENILQADLENAQAENARLLALLHQAQSKPKP
ncbi:hypothetical protein Dimus_007883 [Dionaea muscipula]